MIEIQWGSPLHFTTDAHGGTRRITTIEQAQHWLRKSWPIDDDRRVQAMNQIDAAMECIVPVSSARSAFLSAANSAGLRLEAPAIELR
ncbi:DUF982 domain-containing protein [Paracoccus sp. 1_MG-2023]|uniref:DUF982 domain-containing protein n=1 Tax=unclassified Paracoccus (in: a-proteobacteria) TaxID=2688777 RepID=UPI001C0981A2|nr:MULTISPECIES: DUF982 domain-containing protein [unclassified Paracoccus (in: a-proteobacteria)]MBU2956170.1 DUF982 domain-containing protein [Paracoccus sp. C2R09]MDO6667846.1 DUF982 domain-containing protein [Paracoccus sp. 1_MG-2023]